MPFLSCLSQRKNLLVISVISLTASGYVSQSLAMDGLRPNKRAKTMPTAEIYPEENSNTEEGGQGGTYVQGNINSVTNLDTEEQKERYFTEHELEQGAQRLRSPPPLPSPLDELADDLIFSTFSHSSLLETVQLRGVNKRFQRLVQTALSRLTQLVIPNRILSIFSASPLTEPYRLFRSPFVRSDIRFQEFFSNLERSIGHSNIRFTRLTELTLSPELRSYSSSYLTAFRERFALEDRDLESLVQLFRDNPDYLRKLKSLNLGLVIFTSSGIAPLLEFPNLTQLSARGFNPASWLPVLARRARGQTLSFSNRIQILRLNDSSGSLRSLNSEEADGLSSFTELRELSLEGGSLTPTQLRAMGSRRTLTSLRLPQMMARDDHLAELGNFLHLTHLEIPSEKITEEGIAHLGRLNHLTSLILSPDISRSLDPQQYLNDRTLKAIATHLRHLTVLEIHTQANALTEEGLKELNALPNLRRLVIHSGEFSFELYTQRTHLQDLILGNAARITTHCLSAILASSPHLQELTFSPEEGSEGEEQMDDQTAALIANGLQNLRLLHIGGGGHSTATNFSEQGILTYFLLPHFLPHLNDLSIGSFHLSTEFIEKNSKESGKPTRFKFLELYPVLREPQEPMVHH